MNDDPILARLDWLESHADTMFIEVQLLSALREVLALCLIKEDVNRARGRDPAEATVFTHNIRARIAEALGMDGG